ncbi:hypothetical protein KQX54_012134 [Cotesia glomerata]|uniref:Uncharacterized protein n=1 Tax=Cotesia glomerata TaxID=32391 RepID=A0AAV7J2Y9_COTGL|nr:hypothetical protein KQX54_012134 [Cotesia glomerata]
MRAVMRNVITPGHEPSLLSATVESRFNIKLELVSCSRETLPENIVYLFYPHDPVSMSLCLMSAANSFVRDRVQPVLCVRDPPTRVRTLSYQYSRTEILIIVHFDRARSTCFS